MSLKTVRALKHQIDFWPILLIPTASVLFDYLMHTFYFESAYQSLIQQGLFFVEGLFYYGSKYIVIVGSTLVSLFFPSTKSIYFAPFNGILGATLFSIFYYIYRPVGGFEDLTYTTFLVSMYLNHLLDISLASLLFQRKWF